MAYREQHEQFESWAPTSTSTCIATQSCTRVCSAPLSVCCAPIQECAQELARCLCQGGDQPGTQAHFRIQEIISARVRVVVAWLPPALLPCSGLSIQKSASFLLLPKVMA